MSRPLLDDYVQVCTNLRKDLQYAHHDLQTRQGGQISFAVDFSEIHAFAIPESTLANVEKGLSFDWEDSDETGRIAYESHTLGTLFFNNSVPLVLLPPHRVELRGFIRRLHDEEQRTDVALLSKLVSQRDQLLSSPDFSRIQDLIARNTVGGYIQSEEAEAVIAFIERQAPTIIAALGRADLSPLQRIHQLAQFGAITNPEIEIEPSKTRVAKWERLISSWRIGRHRHHVATYLDAQAMATLEEARELPGEYCLVTRSQALHVAAEHVWPKASPIRSPRAMEIFITHLDLPALESEHLIKRQIELVDLFLNAARESQRYETTPRPEENDLTKQVDILLDKVREQRRALRALVVAGQEGQRPPSWNEHGTAALRRLLSFIADPGAIRGYVKARIEERERSLESLNTVLRISDLDLRSAPSLKVDHYPLKSKVVLHNSGQAFPYTLQFYSTPAQEILNRFGPGNEFWWSHALEELAEALGKWDAEEVEYERWLISAYLLATLGAWEDALLHGQLALKAAVSNETHPCHEVHFFLAVCKRKIWTSQSLREAQENIRRAMYLKRAWASNDSVRGMGDPRYLREAGVISSLEGRRLRQLSRPEGDELIETGTALLHEALAAIENDIPLRIHTLNSLLFHQVDDFSPDFIDSKSAIENLREIELLQRQLEPREDKWPSFLLDTLAWCEWRLIPHDRHLAMRVMNRIELALSEQSISPDERKEILSHFDIIRSNSIAEGFLP